MSYAQFVDAMNIHGAGAELVSNAPDETQAILLVHSLAGHADKALQLAKRVDAARTIPMQFMMDGADVAVSNGMPAAIVRDGYARWANGGDRESKMPSGLVVPTSLARSLGLEAAMETDVATATNSSVPLPEQIARVLLALRDGR